nr:cytoplasmic trehalase [Salmonella sp. NCTC 7297]
MLNQKLNPTPSEDLTIDVDLLYETDPCELKLDEMDRGGTGAGDDRGASRL